ncbi:MAG: DUF998 domain-containing protein [Erythrobacter sp.]
MGLLVLLSSVDPALDPLTQHISEASRASGWLATADKVLPVIAGLSIVLFGFGCFFRLRHWWWTGTAGLLFDAAMIANGVFPAGDPRHGLYGLALFSVLVPACYGAEFSGPFSPRFVQFSLFCTGAGMAYMWMLLIGLDRDAWRALTQRLASLLAFSWYAVTAWQYRENTLAERQ